MRLKQRVEEAIDELPRSWEPWVGSTLVGEAVAYDPEEAGGSCWLVVAEEPATGDLVTLLLSASDETVGDQVHKRFSLTVLARVPAGSEPMGFSGEVPVSQGDLPF